MKNLLVILGLLIVLIACKRGTENTSRDEYKENASSALDAWHMAAASGAYELYFDFFEDSASVFIGTDATERWTVNEFKPWAKPAFSDGVAWTFEPFNRSLYYSSDSSLAWFDEELKTAKLGILRGSGVLKAINGEWKIVHYNLSMPIPNAIIKEVLIEIDALDSAMMKR